MGENPSGETYVSQPLCQSSVPRRQRAILTYSKQTTTLPPSGVNLLESRSHMTLPKTLPKAMSHLRTRGFPLNKSEAWKPGNGLSSECEDCTDNHKSGAA